MLLTLIKIRIKALLSGLGSGSKKKTTKGTKILYAILAIYVLVVFLGLFGIIFYRICDAFIAMGLGWLYFYGEGVMTDFREGCYWMRRAGSQGVQKAIEHCNVLCTSP